ncbi:ParB/RepB/Spo0J family partition protein [Polaribacter sp.]|nr:ParB/RepB/Spo0J family partition protein [Polaribacter sp.]MDB4209550.1 ParB/RepB/Spo0J family partition protein [Polaribacter sp.]
MNYKVELVEISSLSVHPEIKKHGVTNKEAYKKLIPLIKKFKLIEPLRIVKDNNKLFVIQGCSRYRAARDLGIKLLPVIETSPIESDIFLDSIIRNTTIKRSYKEDAVAASYILDRIGNSQGKKRTELPINNDIDNFDEVAKDRYDIARSVLHIDFSVTTLKRLLKIHKIDETPEGSKLRLFDQLENGKGISPVYEIAIETNASRTRKYNRRIELDQEKKLILRQEQAAREEKLKNSIKSDLQEKFEKEYEERYEQEFGCKPKPKSLLELEWDEKINKLQQIRHIISNEDEIMIIEILNKY